MLSELREYEKLQHTHICASVCVHDCRTQWNRNMCMAEVLCAECSAPIRSPPPSRFGPLQMRLSLLILLAVELQIVCVWRQSFCFFSYLRFSVFSSCLFCSCSYSPIKCPPICHDASNISSSSQFVPLHFVVTSWNLYDFYLYFLFAIAPFRHPLDFPFNLICLTAQFAQQIRAYSKCYISHFSSRQIIRSSPKAACTFINEQCKDKL